MCYTIRRLPNIHLVLINCFVTFVCVALLIDFRFSTTFLDHSVLVFERVLLFFQIWFWLVFAIACMCLLFGNYYRLIVEWWFQIFLFKFASGILSFSVTIVFSGFTYRLYVSVVFFCCCLDSNVRSTLALFRFAGNKINFSSQCSTLQRWLCHLTLRR